MSKALEQRIEKLERDAGLTDNGPSVVVVGYWGPSENGPVQSGELLGYTVRGRLIERPPSEAEAAFRRRVIAEHRQQWPNHLVLYEQRGEPTAVH